MYEPDSPPPVAVKVPGEVLKQIGVDPPLIFAVKLPMQGCAIALPENNVRINIKI